MARNKIQPAPRKGAVRNRLQLAMQKGASRLIDF